MLAHHCSLLRYDVIVHVSSSSFLNLLGGCVDLKLRHHFFVPLFDSRNRWMLLEEAFSIDVAIHFPSAVALLPDTSPGLSSQIR